MSFDFPKHWKVDSFESLFEIPLRNGIYKSKEFHGTGVKIINMGELFAHSRMTSSVEMKRVELNSKEIEKAGIDSGDLIFARRSLTAEGAGKCTIILSIDEPTTFESSIIRVRLKKEIAEPEFYYYLFNSGLGKWLLGTILRQVAVSGITGSDLAKLEVPVPPIDEQKQIVSGLRDIDDKINQNKTINELLEQIAQAMFKSWFVDFEPTKAKIAARESLLAENPAATPEQIATAEQQAAIQAIAGAGDIIPTEQLQTIADLFPNQLVDSELGEIPYGWEIKALDQIAHYQNGLALQKFRPESGEDFLPVLKIAQLKAGFADGKEVAKASIKKECIVDNGDVIFSWSGSLVVDIWCGGRVALNQHLFKVTSSTYPKWFYYKWTKYHLEKFQQIAADKAVTMGHIKRSHLSEAKCLIPASELLKNKCIFSLIDKQIQVRLESKVLRDVRDSLLPRLLAGDFSLAKVDSEYE